MKIKIEVFGSMKQNISDYIPGQGIVVEIPTPAKVKDLVTQLKIPISENAMITVNKRLAKLDDELTDGATVVVLPFAGGG